VQGTNRTPAPADFIIDLVAASLLGAGVLTLCNKPLFFPPSRFPLFLILQNGSAACRAATAFVRPRAPADFFPISSIAPFALKE
jgi:hypothetical protein